MTAASMSRLLMAHRSVRAYQARPIEPELVDRVLAESLAGSSSSGNLNMVSVIKTRDAERKVRLADLHFGQPMVLQAPLVLTFCADTFRTRQWQTTALAFESQGLGICYMGTTLHSMGAIAEFLDMPENCLPVTSMVVGWPAESPAQRDRLPVEAWIHDERYERPSAEQIDARFGERERRGWERYRAMGEEMIQRMQEQGITSLAQFYTSRIKYDPDRFAEDSVLLRALLQESGFLPRPALPDAR